MKISEDLKNLFLQIKGKDSYGMASIKTGISKAYIVEIGSGKVPSADYIQRIADGYKLDADSTRQLFITAGYSPPHAEDRPPQNIAEFCASLRTQYVELKQEDVEEVQRIIEKRLTERRKEN